MISQSMMEQGASYKQATCASHSSYPTFSQVESSIEEALGELTEYYRNNMMRANPDKTHVTAFQLRNKETKR